ncbi:AlpA family phage regulatory protein [Halomonas desiderata]|uniref:helix-turn-helix transcriptional regulator n=1 Tax=Billgrantia desiderata TaxID=52021 RepID=UPI00174C631B|nr:AlpA family phage regulatory protein [Halomonas desiderata]
MQQQTSQVVTEEKPVRLMRWKEVQELVGMSHRTIAGMCANGWFPEPVQVSSKVTAFLSNEVEEWLENLKNRRVKYQIAPYARRPETLGLEATPA